MGYDFDFMSPRFKEPVQFPVNIEDVPSEVFPLPWAEFREWLLSSGGEVDADVNRICVDYERDELIFFAGSDQSIYLDTHATWKHVWVAYRKLKSLVMRVCVFDPQSGLIHDERSFGEFLSENGVSTDA